MTAPSLTPSAGTCAREHCPVASTGRCARGFADPLACEEYEPEESAVHEAPDSSGQDSSQPQGSGDDPLVGAVDTRGRSPWRQADQVESLHSGQALTLEEATNVRQRHRSAVAVPVGEVDVGKTTMTAALFEALAAAPTGGWSFVGSLSLMGFEARSHDAMVESGRSHPDTPRTSRDTDRVLLHLSLVHEEHAWRHLLLADVSGEHAESLRRFSDPGDYEDLLKAATCVLLMVDGEGLANTSKRHAETTKARTLYKSMHESGLLASDATVMVVVTKWDLCADAADDISLGVEQLASSVRRSGRVAEVIRLSARPHRGAAEHKADSFDVLIQHLMELPVRPQIDSVDTLISPHLFRDFSPGSALLSRYLKAAP